MGSGPINWFSQLRDEPKDHSINHTNIGAHDFTVYEIPTEFSQTTPPDSLACIHESIFCHNSENNRVMNATKSCLRSRSKETQVWSSKAVATGLNEEKKQDFDAKFWVLPGSGRGY
jgi:hypothetical protein